MATQPKATQRKTGQRKTGQRQPGQGKTGRRKATGGSSRSTETERKFRIAADQQVPDLSELVKLGSPKKFELLATYFDTPDLTLARARRTLRRRTGGHDAGWHLKLPGKGDARTEVQLPLTKGDGSQQVPAELRAEVAELIGTAPLVPAVTLRTLRTETPLTGPRGGRRAQLCDDRVTAWHGGTERSWRELEIELDGGSPKLLDALTDHLAEAGIPVSSSVSKLVQALGESLAEATPRRGRKASAATVLVDYFAEQVGVIQAGEHQLRAGDPAAVHAVRVASRRLRSTLRSFRPLLITDITEPLRTELKWFSGLLGGPRDEHVLAERLGAALGELPAEAVRGPVVERLTDSLAQRHDQGHDELVQALDSARFRRLGDRLVSLVAEPPVVEYAAARAKGVLPELLDTVSRRPLKSWKKARKATGEDRQELLHTTRKRAKAARYAWELATPVFDDTAREQVKAWKKVTSRLGLTQDAQVAGERLLELAAEAEQADESSFTFGVLYARELQTREHDEKKGRKAIEKARKLLG